MQDDKNNETQQPMLSSSDKKVIQPSEHLVQEMQKQQPAPQLQQQSTPTAVVSAPQYETQQPVTTQLPESPKLSAGDPMPVGMSASQLGLDYPSRQIHWGKYVKRTLIAVGIITVAIVGFVYLKNTLLGMTPHTITNGKFTYSFSFYRGSSLVQLPNGYQAYKHDGNMVASVLPTNNDNPPTACYEIGAVWKQVFTAQDFGTTWPVCSPTGTKGSAFTMWFRNQNHSHIFTIVYNNQQPSTVYPTLQKIFSSVKVTQSQ